MENNLSADRTSSATEKVQHSFTSKVVPQSEMIDSASKERNFQWVYDNRTILIFAIIIVSLVAVTIFNSFKTNYNQVGKPELSSLAEFSTISFGGKLNGTNQKIVLSGFKRSGNKISFRYSIENGDLTQKEKYGEIYLKSSNQGEIDFETIGSGSISINNYDFSMSSDISSNYSWQFTTY